jgi:predicted nucleic acid-binding protein
MLLRLGEARVVELWVSSQVLEEIETVIRRKAVQMLATLAVLLDRSQTLSVPAAPEALLTHCQELLSHPGDARILADAWYNQADYLVTLDKAHFLTPAALAGQVPFLIGMPGDCLAWLREILSELGVSERD